MKTIITLLTIITLQTCISNTPPIDNSEPIWSPNKTVQEGLKKAYFASGCFWCVEAIYESVKEFMKCILVMLEDIPKILIIIK